MIDHFNEDIVSWELNQNSREKKMEELENAAKQQLGILIVGDLEKLQHRLDQGHIGMPWFRYSRINRNNEHGGYELSVIPYLEDDRVEIEYVIYKTLKGYDAWANITHKDGYNGHMVANKHLWHTGEVITFISKLAEVDFSRYNPRVNIDLGRRGIKVYADNY